VSFITFRRYYIDKILSSTTFYGKVLDLGGKKNKKRGSFRPPVEKVDKWVYLNIDTATNPDYCCSAESIPVTDETFDIVLMTEVLEHLENPERVISEVQRVLKKDGHIVATMPFLYPIHADPYDFQRWTPARLKMEFEKAGLTIELIVPMGSILAVFYDLISISIGVASKNQRALKNRLVNRFMMPALRSLVLKLDKNYLYNSNIITTGFYVKAIKKQKIK
jgi:SAM-dependent methyltransferase